MVDAEVLGKDLKSGADTLDRHTRPAHGSKHERLGEVWCAGERGRRKRAWCVTGAP
jgi:hypothetical protein